MCAGRRPESFWKIRRRQSGLRRANLEKYLGKEKITFENANEEDEVGIVRGLAWTSVGGDTLQIEVNVMPGKGKLLMTGQMGDVMKESAQTALTYVRSICPDTGWRTITLKSTIFTSIFRRERCPRTDLLPALPWPRPCCPR